MISPARKLYNEATLAGIGTRRITHLQYLLLLPGVARETPTSQNAVYTKFAEYPFPEGG